MERSGGVENYIYSLFTNINKDIIQMDFLIPHKSREDQGYLDQIEEQGGQIYLIPSHKENLIKHIIETYRITRKYKKDGLIHIHVSSGIHAVDGIVARLAGIKNIVYHSHNASFIESRGKKIARFLFKISGTYFLGCTKDAGIYMFGSDVTNSNRFSIAKNGIDTEKFKFDARKRKSIRDEYNIPEDTHLLGFVGRFSSEKNIDFIIETFNKLQDIDSNYMLMLVGDGEQKDLIRDMVYKLDIQDKVILTGARNDIDFIMSGLDSLLLPSKYEALPIVLIEAQASGLPCYVSTGVAKDAKITDLVAYLNLSSRDWIEMILESNKDKDINRNKYAEIVRDSEYDLKSTAKEMEDFYLRILNN